MEHLGNDRWLGSVEVDELGRWQYSIVAWVDRFASWRHELERKVEAGQADLSSELAEGAALLGVEEPHARRGARGRARPSARGRDGTRRAARADRRPRAGAASAPGTSSSRAPSAASPASRRSSRGWPSSASTSSTSRRSTRSATTHRKGRNNSLEAKTGDPGSPWAIGSAEGGHEAVAPELGTLADLERLVAAAAEHGLEIALDLALQCSPDHPWLKEHPEWFQHRPDGTLKYAENPPKRYQDIYNLNFASEDWREPLAGAPRPRPRSGPAAGIRIFRVDNPHTKPIEFWSWLIREAQARPPRPRVPVGGVHAPGADGDARRRPASASPTPTSPGGTRDTSSPST